MGRGSAGIADARATGDGAAAAADDGDEGDHVGEVSGTSSRVPAGLACGAVWADTLLHAEQQHLLRLLLWAALSTVAATAIATTVAVRRLRSPLLTHFALQLALWGIVIGVIAGIEWHGLHLRDLSASARLERLLWLNIGLDVGFVGMGVVLGVSGRILSRNYAAVGAGVGIILQGLALLLIDLQFASIVSR